MESNSIARQCRDASPIILHAETGASSVDNSPGKSPLTKSRYGRTHKPKIDDDYFHLDDIVADYPDAPRANVAKHAKRAQSPARSAVESNAKTQRSPCKTTRSSEKRAKKVAKFVHVTGDSEEEEVTIPIAAKPVAVKSPPIIHNGTMNRKFFKRAHTNAPNFTRVPNFSKEAYVDLSKSDIDVEQVFKIIAKPTADRVHDVEPKSKVTGVKTYGNKRKRTTTEVVVESFALPDTPIFPLQTDQGSPINEPKRMKRIDVKYCAENDVNLVDRQLLDRPWAIGESAEHGGKVVEEVVNVASVDLQLILAGERSSMSGTTNSKSIAQVESSIAQEESSAKVTTIPSPKKNKRRNTQVYAPRCTRSSAEIKRDDDDDVPRKTSSDSGVESGGHETNVDNNNTATVTQLDVIVSDETKNTLTACEKASVDSNEGRPAKRRSQRLSQLGGTRLACLITHVKEEVEDEPDEEESLCLTPTCDLRNEKFELGDLVWARIGKYPLWPSLTCPEPISNQFKRPIETKRGTSVEYHVRFFGDNGRRSWIPGTSMLWLCSAEDLMQFKVRFQSETKYDMMLRACTVKSHLLAKWKIAVVEAIALIDKTPEARIEFFKNLRRKKAPPRIKRVKDQSSETARADIEPKPTETESNTNAAAPPTNDKAVKPPQATEEMSESSSDTESSDATTISTPYEEQVALYKRTNLFRGLTRQKCCQVCAQPGGKVVRCTGPCEGLYHHECGKRLNGQQPATCTTTPTTITTTTATQRGDAHDTIALCEDTESEVHSFTTSLSVAQQIDRKMMELMAGLATYADSEASDKEEHSDNVEEERKQDYGEDSTLETNSNSGSKTSDTTTSSSTYTCSYCADARDPPCFICNKEGDGAIRQRCSLRRCGHFYHPACVRKWPQTQWSCTNEAVHRDTGEPLDAFVCPAHVCHTCSADDPHTVSRCTNDKIVKCVRCPATYHAANHCVPAGTQIVSASQVICPRHLATSSRQRKAKTTAPTINATWCFACSKGGDLICCETCPTSVHYECVAADYQEDGTFLCEDCEIGRFPLYDEVVWTKLGMYRWWPSVILFPSEVPDYVRAIAHEEGDFVVEFLETHDYAWINRGRVFLFDEGDKGCKKRSKGRFDVAFNKAVDEAAELYQLKKDFRNRKIEEINQRTKPPHYVKIKANKPIGFVRQIDASVSNTTACDCNPNDPFPCGPDSDCLNRLLLTECNPEICPAAHRCKNQRFEKREYPPLKPYKTVTRGWGLKTLAPIPKGNFVIEYVGEVIDEKEYQCRVKRMTEKKDENYYFLTLDKDRIIDAGPKGNMARFMNHSCQPNCETQKWTVNGETRVGLFALMDIAADAEVTFNYNLECIGEGKKVCRCDGTNCTGFISAKVKQDEGVRRRKSNGARKKFSIVPAEPLANGPCFVCHKDGKVLTCQNKICTKSYHIACVGLDHVPDGRWTCAWHNCNTCGKRTIRSCSFCLNSYCPSHSHGFVRHDKLLGFVCATHDPINANIMDAEKIKTPTASEETLEVPSDHVDETIDDEDDKPLAALQSEAAKKAVAMELKNLRENSSDNENNRLQTLRSQSQRKSYPDKATSKTKKMNNKRSTSPRSPTKNNRLNSTPASGMRKKKQSSGASTKPSKTDVPLVNVRTTRRSTQCVELQKMDDDNLPIGKRLRRRDTITLY